MVPLGSLLKYIRSARLECLSKRSSTWFSGTDGVESIMSLGIKKVVFCGIFSCTILVSTTKVK